MRKNGVTEKKEEKKEKKKKKKEENIYFLYIFKKMKNRSCYQIELI